MAKTNEDSVLMNLNDLFEMETERRVAEATHRERERAEEVARLERERAEREQAILEAREAERRRVEADRASRDEELDDRIASLREQLDRVRQEREAARLAMADATARPPERTGRAGWIASVMAALSLIAAVGAIYMSWPRPVDTTPIPGPVVVTVEEPVATPDVEPADEPAVEAPVADEASEPVATADRAERPRPRPRPRPAQTDDIGSALDFGTGDDVLGDGFLNGAGR